MCSSDLTKDTHANRNIDILRQFVKEQSLPHYFDVGTDNYKGVCHIALAQEGFNRPGDVLFGTDSHTSTSGAFGMFSTGIGNTDAAFILGTGKLWVRVPETMCFEFIGTFPEALRIMVGPPISTLSITVIKSQSARAIIIENG